MACGAKLLYTLAIEPEKPKLLTLFESGMGEKNERGKRAVDATFSHFPWVEISITMFQYKHRRYYQT